MTLHSSATQHSICAHTRQMISNVPVPPAAGVEWMRNAPSEHPPLNTLSPRRLVFFHVIGPQCFCIALQQGEQFLGCVVPHVIGDSVAQHKIVVAAGIGRHHVRTRCKQEEHVVGQRPSHLDEVSRACSLLVLVVPAQVDLSGDVPDEDPLLQLGIGNPGRIPVQPSALELLPAPLLAGS
jgi:hypothetical protein